MKTIAGKKSADSPVYTFVKNLTPPVIAAAVAAIAAAVSSPAAGSTASAAAPASNPTISVLMGQAEQAIESNNFIVAKALLTELRRMMPDELWVTHKLVLATYKSKLPTEQAALQEACDLLDGLNARDSTDTETLGLLQAVHKRLWNITQNRVHLDKAIWSSEKGFYLKNDYYNGINLAFLYNVRASQSEGVEAVADFVLAQRTRRRVVTVCEELLQEGQAAIRHAASIGTPPTGCSRPWRKRGSASATRPGHRTIFRRPRHFSRPRRDGCSTPLGISCRSCGN